MISWKPFFFGFVLVQRTDDLPTCIRLGWFLCLFLITLAEYDTRLHILFSLFSFYFIFLTADLIRCFFPFEPAICMYQTGRCFFPLYSLLASSSALGKWYRSLSTQYWQGFVIHGARTRTREQKRQKRKGFYPTPSRSPLASIEARPASRDTFLPCTVHT